MSKMRAGLLLITPLLGLPAHASPKTCDSVNWKSDEGRFEVCYQESQKAFLSTDCAQKKCGASELLKLAKDYIPAPSLHDGRLENPGSAFCRDLGGKIVIAKNDRGSQTAFCMAKDKSVVALTSLANRR